MCGIAGWYRRGGQPVEERIIAGQCNRIIHRGPDDCGYFTDGDFGFGMRRLSIIDLEGGHQPIFSADRRFAIVFNGEIYNHPDLRRELARLGATFRTQSDTETLLSSWLQWGDDAWLKLDGMYAVAIWDRAEHRLTLARDPLGIKPLYFTEQHGGIAFGSEIRSLRVLPNHRFDIDERGVHDFFTFGHVQRPRSVYRQVRSLEPGHVLRIGPTGEADVREFWRPQFRVRHDLSEADWVEETRSRVQGTVERHMLADVTVGAFLSGGVDSSAITAAMTQAATAPVKAFTVGFPGTSIDETAAAARIADHLGAEHVVLSLEPTRAGDLLPAVQASFDEPCAATAAVPVWHLSRLAAQHVKVVLCGEGSDEIFAGYKRQQTALRAARMRPYLRAMKPLMSLVDLLPGRSEESYYRWQKLKRRRSSALLENNFQRFFESTQISTPEVREQLYTRGFHDRWDTEDRFRRLEEEYFSFPGARSLHPLDQFMLADIAIHMPGSLLNRLDRGSMAHSLEARVPFLSHHFVDWSLTMPRDMKLHGKVGKYALRQAIKPWLPADALDKRKLGFQLPFREWFKGEFSDFAREAWHDSGAVDSGYLQQAAVEQLFDDHRSGVADYGRILYAIAMFSCWWQQQREVPKSEAA